MMPSWKKAVVVVERREAVRVYQGSAPPVCV